MHKLGPEAQMKEVRKTETHLFKRKYGVGEVKGETEIWKQGTNSRPGQVWSVTDVQRHKEWNKTLW